jgi:hypothetical protein
MYEDFVATERWTGKQVHVAYRALQTAISTRHADAVDVKFTVDDRTVWVAMPHPAWVRYQVRTGRVLTDPLAIQAAGHYLKQAIENGSETGREMYALSLEETLEHVNAVVAEKPVPVPE